MTHQAGHRVLLILASLEELLAEAQGLGVFRADHPIDPRACTARGTACRRRRVVDRAQAPGRRLGQSSPRHSPSTAMSGVKLATRNASSRRSRASLSGKRLEDLERLGKMMNGFLVGRTVARMFPRFLPVIERLIELDRLRVMLGPPALAVSRRREGTASRAPAPSAGDTPAWFASTAIHTPLPVSAHA